MGEGCEGVGKEVIIINLMIYVHAFWAKKRRMKEKVNIFCKKLKKEREKGREWGVDISTWRD